MRKLSKVLQKYKYEDGETEEFYYYEIADEFLDLDSNKMKEVCNDKIESIKKSIAN